MTSRLTALVAAAVMALIVLLTILGIGAASIAQDFSLAGWLLIIGAGAAVVADDVAREWLGREARRGKHARRNP